MSAPERYGKRNVAKMIRQVEAHRQAVRSEGTPAIQETWDKIEEHIDYAYRADLAPAAPKVKALEWKWHRDPRDMSEARTTIGTWTIWEIDGSAYCHGPNDTCGKPCKGGLDGAKAAAQADYEARILAALEGGDG